MEKVIIEYQDIDYNHIWSQDLDIPWNYNSVGAIELFKEGLQLRKTKPFNAYRVEIMTYVNGDMQYSEGLVL